MALLSWWPPVTAAATAAVSAATSPTSAAKSPTTMSTLCKVKQTPYTA
eukprot:CAMPEP_0205910580 /NCGR_PEP_ID=MMETSP1325-20131115/4525_1 /ASSEMBLY_ACC=CAM_ASM_000708 /TAXON_ID=236786 /ORGANISM="Florenciella sp., Strain RCC1007" /LENGTH=47 /DNA_ID= /DNA_START= /DNA_END= /DNA_ORIENTATION=